MAVEKARLPRALTDLVLACLPRELRDIVYDYLWDIDTIKELNYLSHIRTTIAILCPYLNLSQDGQSVCMCDRPDTIPQFVRPDVVGNQFVYEAVTWLYDNYEDFCISDLKCIRSFLKSDVFHIGLTPSSTRLRHLKIEVHPSIGKTRTKLTTFPNSFNPLVDLPFSVSLQLGISRYRNRVHGNTYRLAMLIRAFKELVARLGDARFSLSLRYTVEGAGKIFFEHVLGSIEVDRWWNFPRSDIQAIIELEATYSLQVVIEPEATYPPVAHEMEIRSLKLIHTPLRKDTKHITSSMLTRGDAWVPH